MLRTPSKQNKQLNIGIIYETKIGLMMFDAHQFRRFCGMEESHYFLCSVHPDDNSLTGLLLLNVIAIQ